jgi:excisionase family DNA binding protein
MNQPPPHLLTVHQVALRFGIGTRTVWRWVAGGRLPQPLRLANGRITRWRAEDIDKWITQLAGPR